MTNNRDHAPIRGKRISLLLPEKSSGAFFTPRFGLRCRGSEVRAPGGPSCSRPRWPSQPSSIDLSTSARTNFQLLPVCPLSTDEARHRLRPAGLHAPQRRIRDRRKVRRWLRICFGCSIIFFSDCKCLQSSEVRLVLLETEESWRQKTKHTGHW